MLELAPLIGLPLGACQYRECGSWRLPANMRGDLCRDCDEQKLARETRESFNPRTAKGRQFSPARKEPG